MESTHILTRSLLHPVQAWRAVGSEVGQGDRGHGGTRVVSLKVYARVKGRGEGRGTGKRERTMGSVEIRCGGGASQCYGWILKQPCLRRNQIENRED